MGQYCVDLRGRTVLHPPQIIPPQQERVYIREIKRETERQRKKEKTKEKNTDRQRERERKREKNKERERVSMWNGTLYETI
jgi:superfamily II DNA or RNA helicase